jgi:aspartate-semialdehyde dehydrogenase
VSYRVGVVGATGAVGSTIIDVLADREFPVSELVPFASERSAGRKIAFRGGEVEVRALGEDGIDGLDLVLSSAGGAVSAEWAPRFVAAGAVVVDNTSYWRMHDDVPLVVAEVNPDDGRAGADPSRRRDRADRLLHLPVGVGHRPERGRGAARAVAGDPRRRGAAG